MSNDSELRDPVYTGLTRPATFTIGGAEVPYLGVALNAMASFGLFYFLGRNPLVLFVLVPNHYIIAGLCKEDLRIFDLWVAWLRVVLPIKNGRRWGGASFRP